MTASHLRIGIEATPSSGRVESIWGLFHEIVYGELVISVLFNLNVVVTGKSLEVVE